jgi:hypothetical protein
MKTPIICRKIPTLTRQGATLKLGSGGIVSKDAAILGVNIAAGVAYLGLATRSGELLPDVCTKIVPPANATEWMVLRQFGERMLAEAKAHGATEVVFVEPRYRRRGWPYSQAHTRASLYTAAGLSLASAMIIARSISQKSIAAGFDCKTEKEMDKSLAGLLDLSPKQVVHWKERSIAMAAALHVARKAGQ